MTHEPGHEIVTILDFDQYERLLRFFDIFPGDAKTQRNHYFGDEDGLLERNNLTLRIREKGETFQIDLKVPLSRQDEGGMLEISDRIGLEYFDRLKKKRGSFPRRYPGRT